ncbi:hypothetical protein [Pseudooceanicola nanhaiensis]|uniref:hypothetical protein n=1 Tax=Pseudooceanicola nanhaiensis TaxID=375761 RepID=UPI001CD6EBB0|nr:hypothetical protein [Pseudooceanicola nanhaiensis]MCA0920534.1 hypothetical protein [Pseudooceanicola nanhaiensis]
MTRSIPHGPTRSAPRAERMAHWLLQVLTTLALALFAGQGDRSEAAETAPSWTLYQTDMALVQPVKANTRATEDQPDSDSGNSPALPVEACVLPLGDDEALPQCMAPAEALDPRSAHGLRPEPRAPPFSLMPPHDA